MSEPLDSPQTSHGLGQPHLNTCVLCPLRGLVFMLGEGGVSGMKDTKCLGFREWAKVSQEAQATNPTRDLGKSNPQFLLALALRQSPYSHREDRGPLQPESTGS